MFKAAQLRNYNTYNQSQYTIPMLQTRLSSSKRALSESIFIINLPCFVQKWRQNKVRPTDILQNLIISFCNVQSYVATYN